MSLGHQLGGGLARAPETAEDNWLISGGGAVFKQQSFMWEVMKVFMSVSNTKLQEAFPGGSKIRGSSCHSPLLQEEKQTVSQSRDPW